MVGQNKKTDMIVVYKYTAKGNADRRTDGYNLCTVIPDLRMFLTLKEMRIYDNFPLEVPGAKNTKKPSPQTKKTLIDYKQTLSGIWKRLYGMVACKNKGLNSMTQESFPICCS